MKVLFLTSSRQYFKNLDEQKIIKKSISALGHELLPANSDETIFECLDKDGQFDADDWQVLYERILESGERCSAAIFDVSDKGSFGLGYMAAMCLMSARPVLILQKENDSGSIFASGLQHHLLTRGVYNRSNITGIVKRFLDEVAISGRIVN